MPPSLWHLLQQPKRNKTACDSSSQCLIVNAMDISKQRKRLEVGSWGRFVLTRVVSEVFVSGGT